MARLDFDLNEMFALWNTGGYSIPALARRYAKDRTTIRHHLIKAGLFVPISRPQYIARAKKRRVAKRKEVKLPEPPPPHKYDHIWNETVNPGRPYSYYLEQAKKRPVEAAYFALFQEVDLARESTVNRD